jgi:glucuronoarabinoxylan endo-1,4-beta-xylanase
VNEQQVPVAVTLMQNYPNPFNPFTTIRYELPVHTHVTLKIFDVLGRDVRTLVEADQQAGSYRVLFDGSNLASGVYFYRLQTHRIERGQAGDLVQSKKLLLLK